MPTIKNETAPERINDDPPPPPPAEPVGIPTLPLDLLVLEVLL